MDLRKCLAEAIGTFWLTFAGCGSAVLAAAFPGGRDRPARRVARLRADGAHHGLRDRPRLRLPPQPGGDGRALPPAGASRRRDRALRRRAGGRRGIVGAASSTLIASGAPGFDLAKGFAANGYGEHSPGQYGLFAGLVAEIVLTMMFLFIIMGATHGKAPAGFAPIAIGLRLTLIHLVAIPVTNTSVNPARSTGPALFVGGWALAQLWLFWVAPLIGGALGGILYRWLSEEPSAQVTGTARPSS